MRMEKGNMYSEMEEMKTTMIRTWKGLRDSK